MKNNKLIIGSGLPKNYLDKDLKLYWSKNKIYKSFFANINFIYLGRLLKSKGINTFIDFSKRFENINFNIYGDVDLFNNDSLTKLDILKYRDKQKNLKFEGTQDDPLLRKKYKYPILFVPSNYGEGLPRSILEALALKIPVICSKNSTCDVFTEEIVYISEGSNMESYITCFEKLLDDYIRGKIVYKLDKGFQFVKNNLTEEIIVNQTLDVYRELVSLEKV